jgi:hypothetical protein
MARALVMLERLYKTGVLLRKLTKGFVWRVGKLGQLRFQTGLV